MDNEQDYIELHRLLAKYKFALVREVIELNPADMVQLPIRSHYEEKVKQIDNLMKDIPIIIKGDEK